MSTLAPQQEFRKLAYLKALGIQPLVLVRQPTCGLMLPRAMPVADTAVPASFSSTVATEVTREAEIKSAPVVDGNPAASLAAARESLMGGQAQSESQMRTVPEVEIRSPEVGNRVSVETAQTNGRNVETDALSLTDQISANAQKITLPTKFTALVYVHAHVTLVAMGAQLQAQHWALSKNISLACHAVASSESDAAARPSVLEFHWPIPGVSANETDAAKSAFAGFLSKHTAQSDTRILLLGDFSQQLAQVFVQHAAGKQVLMGPSLDAMLSDHSFKRALWRDLIANGFA